VEPINADDWLKSMEKKFQVVQCNNRENVLVASQQLSGPTADWWDAYVEAHEEPESINWSEFGAAFHAHNVSQGVIKMKKNEFQNLKQGSMSMNEYATKFTQLSCYATNEVDTNKKMQDCLLNGLNDGLAYALEARDFKNFKGILNKALVMENHRGMMECKHKLVHQHQPCSSSRPRVGTPSAGHVFRLAQPQFLSRPQSAGQGFSILQCQVIQCPNNFQTPATGSQIVQRIQAAQNPMQTERKCYACGEKGHLANRCPNPCPHPNQPATTTPTPTCGANSVSVATRQNYARWRVNHVAVKEAQEAPDVVLGMFFINATSIIVLFDSGASYSFISVAYIEKHNLPIALLKCQMIVSSLGGDMPARQL
jgi:hypothetical protein